MCSIFTETCAQDCVKHLNGFTLHPPQRKGKKSISFVSLSSRGGPKTHTFIDRNPVSWFTATFITQTRCAATLVKPKLDFNVCVLHRLVSSKKGDVNSGGSGQKVWSSGQVNQQNPGETRGMVRGQVFPSESNSTPARSKCLRSGGGGKYFFTSLSCLSAISFHVDLQPNRDRKTVETKLR